jgi:small-conductance mechanosensitive channel
MGLLTNALLGALLQRRHRREPFTIADMPLQLKYWHRPLRALIPAALLRSALPLMDFPQPVAGPLGHFLVLWIIASIGWFFRSTVTMVREMVMQRYPVDVEDNLQARRVQTQFRVIGRIATATVVILVLSAMLMTFEEVREFGVSLLASAGVVGIVLGFAAQKSLGTLMAGIQIAISQPIRLDDVVIVEGEWGRIEEITLTYVVVKIWDERRLVVPITYFIDHVFENWTHTSAQLLGTVYLYADYTVPVEVLRKELHRILEHTPLWDGRVGSLLVTDSTEKTVELRALVSAEDSSTAWRLRCHVREGLITFLQGEYPGSLPRLRLEGVQAEEQA